MVSLAAGVWTNVAASTVSAVWIDHHKMLVWAVMGFFWVVAVVQVLRERGSSAVGGLALRELTASLAAAVRAERQTFLDQALGTRHQAPLARVMFNNPGPGDLPVEAETLLTHWQSVDGHRAGDIETVTSFYQQQAQGRLVVLGPPGAGKTTLLSHLVLNLIALGHNPEPVRPHQPSHEELDQRVSGPARVPVLLSLASFNPGDPSVLTDQQLADRLMEWVATQLTQAYQVPVHQARRLLTNGMILPILDGLDEMDSINDSTISTKPPGDRAGALLRALNTSPRQPVVLASRNLEYRALSRPETTISHPSILTDADHILLQPLDPAIIAHLTYRFARPHGQLPARWESIAHAITVQDNNSTSADADLYSVLANPWELFLAVTAYQDETSAPRYMTGKTAIELQDHLLANFIPAVISADSYPGTQGWTPERAHRWLASIARHQHGSTRRTDIHLPDLWTISNRYWPRWIPAIIPATITAPYAFLAAAVGGAHWIAALVAACITASLVFIGAFQRTGSFERIDLKQVRTSKGRRKLWKSVLITVVLFCAVAGLRFLIGKQPQPGLALAVATAGLFTGAVVLGLVIGLTVDVTAAASPAALERQCVQFAVVNGLLFGIALGVLAGVVFAIAGEPAIGLVFGLTFALSLGVVLALTMFGGAVWLRYAMGVRSAARRDLLAKHTTRFLTWSLYHGILRMSGVAIQFRHRQLQDWLVHNEFRAAGDTPTAASTQVATRTSTSQ